MRPAEVLLCFSFGTETLLQATAGAHLSIGLENRRQELKISSATRGEPLDFKGL
jgi:hypothetical protein